MKTRYIYINDNEEIYIINPKNNCGIKVKRKEDTLYIEEANNINKKQNVDISKSSDNKIVNKINFKR